MKRVRNELFEENRREEENYMEDQRNWSRNERENGQRRLRRIVTGTVPPSGGTPVNQHLVVPQLEGRTINSSIQEARGSYRTKISLEVSEDSEMVGSGDFQGVHKKDMNSQLRKIIRRIKDGLVSDPTMTGKIMNRPGGRLHKFCCDTGCSTNIMPARLAAMNGLEWYDVDKDEPSYKSVTNQSLEVIGQTQCFIKLQKLRNPVKLSFLVVMDDSDESLLSLDTLKDLSTVFLGKIDHVHDLKVKYKIYM